MTVYLVAVTFSQMEGKGIGIAGLETLTAKRTRCWLVGWSDLSRALACVSYISRIPRHGRWEERSGRGLSMRSGWRRPHGISNGIQCLGVSVCQLGFRRRGRALSAPLATYVGWDPPQTSTHVRLFNSSSITQQRRMRLCLRRWWR